jgi:hypothetical protein
VWVIGFLTSFLWEIAQVFKRRKVGIESGLNLEGPKNEANEPANLYKFSPYKAMTKSSGVHQYM